jgi:hypothetical protein
MSLSETDVDVAVDLLEALAQLLDLVGLVLDPPGQVAHLLLEPIHSHLQINRGVAAALGAWWRLAAGAAIDLTLQHAKVAFEAVETLLGRGILGLCRRTESGDRQKYAQHGRAGLRQN